jgi:hypothetical protein
MLVHKKVTIDGVEYEHYQIKRLEWDLDTLLVGLMVIYYDDENKHAAKVKTHYFKTDAEVDVNKLIDELENVIHKKG